MLVDAHTHNRESVSDSSIQTLLSLRPLDSAPTQGWYSRGLHPWYIEDLTQDALELLDKEVQHPCCRAIGEAGLDRVCGTDFSLQQHYFAEQIRLSETHALPLVIHCVRAWSELLAYHKRFAPKQSWIVHGFRGKPTLAKQLLRAGLVLSMGEYAPAASMRLAYEADRLLLETDDSHSSIQQIYLNACQILELPMVELERRLWSNAQVYLNL